MTYTKNTWSGATPISADWLNHQNTGVVNLHDALYLLAPVGMIEMFPNTTTPDGWLKCNGQAVSRSTYSELFTAIGTTYGIGDGSTTFNLPDCRGIFPRALDDGKGIDTGRTIGSYQGQQNKSHTHDGSDRYVQSGQSDNWRDSTYGRDAGSTQHLTGLTGGSEFRPKNIAVVYYIKY